MNDRRLPKPLSTNGRRSQVRLTASLQSLIEGGRWDGGAGSSGASVPASLRSDGRHRNTLVDSPRPWVGHATNHRKETHS